MFRACERRPILPQLVLPAEAFALPTGLAPVYELIDSPAFLVPLRRCTVTADAHRPAPDIEGANVEERSEATQQDRIVLDLPPSSFTVIEAPTAGLLT